MQKWILRSAMRFILLEEPTVIWMRKVCITVLKEGEVDTRFVSGYSIPTSLGKFHLIHTIHILQLAVCKPYVGHHIFL